MFLLHALLRKYLLVFYHSKQVLIATSNPYEMLNTKILLKVHSLCIFSQKKKCSLYQELRVCLWNALLKNSRKQNDKKKKKSHKVVTSSLEKWCPVLSVYVKWEAYWSILQMFKWKFLAFLKAFSAVVLIMDMWHGSKMLNHETIPYFTKSIFKNLTKIMCCVSRLVLDIFTEQSPLIVDISSLLYVIIQMSHSWNLGVCMHYFRQQVAFLYWIWKDPLEYN